MNPELVYRTELTPLAFLERSADVFREKPAVVYGESSYTYPQLRARVAAAGFGAAPALGSSTGDRVAVLCPNIPPMLEAHYGVPLAGAVLVAINTRLCAGRDRATS